LTVAVVPMPVNTSIKIPRVWLHACSSCSNTSVQRITNWWEKEGVTVEKWQPSSQQRIGIIFLKSLADYEEAISFLQLQVKGKGHRVCVLNLDATVFDTESKVRILKYGADYFFESSLLNDQYEAVVARLIRWVTIDSLLLSPIITSRVAGNSLVLSQTLRQVIEVSFFSKNNLLLLGERGVGKEQIACIVHELDPRDRKGELIILDCTTLKKELSGSELFGHEKGAFTGADSSREGAIALANNGTFFMDEIVELPFNLQAEFLRVIQEGSYKRVGSNNWRHSAFRLIAATNKDLRQCTADGEFRSDLLDRIDTTSIQLPSLNQRREDIPAIIDFYLAKFFSKHAPFVEKEVYEFLTQRDYPGNVRQLKNIMQNIFMKYSGKGPITLGDIPWIMVLPVHSPHSEQDKWYDEQGFLSALQQAIDSGYDLKQIEDVIQAITTRITLNKVGKNKEASRILGKSERWIQLQKSKERI